MSAQSSKQRIQVPDSLREILLEFSIAYLLEQPGDVVDYAVEFFTKLQENRKTQGGQGDAPASPDESIMSVEEGKSVCFALFSVTLRGASAASPFPLGLILIKTYSVATERKASLCHVQVYFSVPF